VPNLLLMVCVRHCMFFQLAIRFLPSQHFNTQGLVGSGMIYTQALPKCMGQFAESVGLSVDNKHVHVICICTFT
jgi:hypothetical protein